MGRSVKSEVKYNAVDTGSGLSRTEEIARLVKTKQRLQRQINTRRKMISELIESLEKLRRLSAYLRQSNEIERTIVAREIHDELGQSLTALKMNTNWLFNHLQDKDKQLRQRVEAMAEIIDSTILTVKTICTDLRPGVLDDLGIAAALEWQSDKFQNMTGIKCDFHISSAQVSLDKDKSTCLFRIFQEILTNVTRHAHATRVKADLRRERAHIVLLVKDNGVGISVEHISSPDSLGLLGMMERARSVGGQFKIKGTAGRGTVVTVKIPCEETGEDS